MKKVAMTFEKETKGAVQYKEVNSARHSVSGIHFFATHTRARLIISLSSVET